MDPLIQILKRLEERGLDFVLIGGMAAVAHGSTMVTRDVDIATMLDDESLEKIVAALQGLNARWSSRPDKFIPLAEAKQLRGFKNLYIATDSGEIDILGEVDGVGTFIEVRTHSVQMDVGGLSCRVIDINALIAAKRAAGRDKDRIAVRHLEAIKKARGL